MSLKQAILTFLLLTWQAFAHAQNTSGATSDAQAEALLDKALGKAIENHDIGISFEGIAYGIKNPRGIFTLPVYEQVRGGYFYMKGDKFEMHLGLIKSISDGKIMVVIDEASKAMYVDSVKRTMEGGDSLQSVAMQKAMEETFGDATLKYEGEETLNAIPCHRIKALITAAEAPASHVYYWINKQNGQLYLMAEFQNEAYDVYWFSNIAKSPANYSYEINLPKTEMEEFHGYEVLDNRFISYTKPEE